MNQSPQFMRLKCVKTVFFFKLRFKIHTLFYTLQWKKLKILFFPITVPPHLMK